MNKLLYFFIAVFLFATQSHLYAQQGVQKKIIQLKAPNIVNFKQLADYERAHPLPKKPHAVEQGEDREEKYKFRKKHLHVGAKSFNISLPSPGAGTRTSSSSSPSPSIIFNGITDNGTVIPPDIEGAAGAVYLLEVTNQEFDLFTKNGALNSVVSPYTLFASTGGNGYFDPHVVYDHTYGRYLICMGGYLSDGNSGVFLAVSANSDPTGNWYLYAFDGTGDPNDLLDFPLLGYNKNWVVITGNDFTEDANPIGKIFVFNRAATYSGASGTITSFSDSNSFSMSPAQTFDSSQATEYLVEDYDGDNGGNGYMQIPTITGTASAPAYSTGSTIGVNHTWDETPIPVPQLGSSYTLEVGDTRVGGSSVYSNGTLWFSHTVFLPTGSPTHDGVDWWQVDPAALTVKQYGRIQDASGILFYFYPSISVNRGGDALLGYCESSTNMYASSSYSFHAKTDAAGVMENTYLFQAGLESYLKELGGGRNRWGDFTGVALDPTDSSFWDFNEWANKNNNWATVVTNVLATGSTECIIPSGLTTTNITDSSVTFSWNAVPGDAKYYIEYRLLNGSAWTIDSTTATSYSVYALNATTQYQWQLQSSCSPTARSLYTPPVSFQTLAPCDVSAPVSSTPVSVCAGDPAVLTATGTGTIYWFALDTISNPLATGNHFTTPPLISNITYYTASSVLPAIQFAGPPDSTFGTASIFTDNASYHDLIFDCYAETKLVSVKVYADGAGYRTITLEDPIGDTLASATINIPDGTSRVTLNFDLPIENNLQLGIVGTVYLLRNNAGASFPYILPNVLSINGTNADGLPGYYYYFYDWEIQRPACNSPLTEVNVNVMGSVPAFSSAVYGDSVAFTNHSTTATSWLWTFGDGDSSTLPSPAHNYRDSGTYDVILRACADGCCDTVSHQVVVIATGISSISANNTIRVYPNPVDGNLLIAFGSMQAPSSILKFTNSIGQIVFEKMLTADEMSGDYVFDTSPFADGIYILTIENEQGRFIQEVVKD